MGGNLFIVPENQRICRRENNRFQSQLVTRQSLVLHANQFRNINKLSKARSYSQHGEHRKSVCFLPQIRGSPENRLTQKSTEIHAQSTILHGNQYEQSENRLTNAGNFRNLWKKTKLDDQSKKKLKWIL